MSNDVYYVRLTLPIAATSTKEAAILYEKRVMEGGAWNVDVHNTGREEKILGSHKIVFKPQAHASIIRPACEESTDLAVEEEGEARFVDGMLEVPMVCDSCLHQWKERR